MTYKECEEKKIQENVEENPIEKRSLKDEEENPMIKKVFKGCRRKYYDRRVFNKYLCPIIVKNSQWCGYYTLKIS